MQDYPYLRLLAERGAWIAALAAVGIFGAALVAITTVGNPYIWVAMGFAAACFACFLCLVMRDIAKAIIETLVPAP